MEYLMIYLFLSCFVTVMVCAIFMNLKEDNQSLRGMLVNRLLMDEELADRIQICCDQFRQGDPKETDLVIFQCAYQGEVTPNDFAQIMDCFPGMIKSPLNLKNKMYDYKLSFNEFLTDIGVNFWPRS